MNEDDLLFAIDGVVGQCATAKIAAEGLGQSTVPIESIYASLMVLRMLVEKSITTAEVILDPDICSHPADRVQRTVVGGGNYVLLCTACNEIIEQS